MDHAIIKTLYFMDPIEDSPDLQILIELWYAFLLSHNCDIDFQFR